MRTTPVALIRWGTRAVATNRRGDLGRYCGESGGGPYGTAHGHRGRRGGASREQLNWFERRPLFGKRILVTRAEAQAGEFSDLISGRRWGSRWNVRPFEIVPPRRLGAAGSGAVARLSDLQLVDLHQCERDCSIHDRPAGDAT